MRVALVIGDYDAVGGGAERWTDLHARRLLDRGFEVHLIARRFRDAPDDATCHYIQRQLWGRRRIGFGRAVEQLLADQSFDIVHDMGDGWAADILMPHYGTRKGIIEQTIRLKHPVVRWFRMMSNPLLPRYLEFAALERRKYGHSERMLVLAVSHMVGENLQRFHGVPQDRIRVIHNGVDIHHFKPSEDDASRQNTLSQLGVQTGETLFLIVTHDFRRKGLDVLVKAMGRLVEAGHKARLLVVGTGEIARYKRLASKFGAGDAVHFIGDQHDPLSYYHAADVFVLPTYYDPCSLVVLEALACGLPVITTKVNGVHEFMEQERDGFVMSDPEALEELVSYMTTLLDPDRRAEASRAARALAEQHTVERNCDEHVGVYEEVIQARQNAG